MDKDNAFLLHKTNFIPNQIFLTKNLFFKNINNFATAVTVTVVTKLFCYEIL